MRALLTIFACTLLIGCVRYRPQPLSAEENGARYEERSLSAELLQQYLETNLHRAFPTWPPPTWDLETLTLAAFYFNPDLAVARAKYESASAGKITAAQRPNPTVSVSPAYNTSTKIPSPWLVTATLDVPIETAGKRAHRRAQAQYLSDAALFALTTAAWDVRVHVRRALVEFWAAQQSETILQEQRETQESLVALLEQELAAGGISPVDVSRERIALEQTKLAKLDAESRRVQARTLLAGAIGLPTPALEKVTISFETFNQPPADLPHFEARRRALFSRTDVLGALAEYAASESALQLEIAKQYPDVHLNPGYEFDQGDDKWGVGLSLELPILNHNRGPITEADARRRESAAKFNALQARVLGEIETALAGCENARQKYAAAAELVAQSQKQAQLTEGMFRAGEISKQAAVTTKLEAVNASLARLDALLKMQQATATLENALQSPAELPVSFIIPPAQTKTSP